MTPGTLSDRILARGQREERLDHMEEPMSVGPQRSDVGLPRQEDELLILVGQECEELD